MSSEHDGTQSHEDSLQLLPEGVFSRKVIDTIRESMGESERKVSEFDDAAAPSVSAMGRKLRQSSVQVSTILSQSKKQELYNSFTHQAEEKRKIQQVGLIDKISPDVSNSSLFIIFLRTPNVTPPLLFSFLPSSYCKG